MVCVILPVLNEEEGLKDILPKLHKYEVVIVDGRSADKSVEVAKRFGAKIIIQESRGKGNAFQEFMKKYHGKQDKFVMLDSDGTYEPEEVQKFIQLLEKCDVVMGNRKFLPGSLSLINIIGNYFLTLSAVFLYWYPVKDLCTGYWGFNKEFLRKANISAKGFELEANLFSEAVKKRFKICQYPINLRKRKGEKKLKWTHGFGILFFLIKNRFT